MSSRKVFKIYMNSKPDESTPKPWVNITLNYVFDQVSINKMIISGPVGKSFKLSYYWTLGVPHGYEINCVVGKVPSEFYRDSQIIIRIIKSGTDDYSADYNTVGDSHADSKITSTPVSLNHSYSQIIPYKDPYIDVSTMLLALGYSLKALGKTIEHLRHV